MDEAAGDQAGAHAEEVDAEGTEAQDAEVEATAAAEARNEKVAPTAQVAQIGLSQVDSRDRVVLMVGLAVVVVLAVLGGWVGYRAYQTHQTQPQRELFLDAGKRGAQNLTSIDYNQADADVKRVLDSATGKFYDDFNRRAPSFTDVVKQVKSKSTGTVTAAGVESISGDSAEVLVAVTVNTEVSGGPPQPVRAFRMRLTVQKVAATPRCRMWSSCNDRDRQKIRICFDPNKTGTPRPLGQGVGLPGAAAAGGRAGRRLGLRLHEIRYAPQRTDTARVESVQAARDGVEKLLTYQPDQVRQQLTDARALTTGSFRSDYAAMTQGVIVGAEQNHISAVTKAPAAASMSASPDHAVVLVFINQTVVVGDQTPTATPTSVKVTLDREGGKWLISGFETV